MTKTIIDKFIILKLDNGIKGYYFQAHNAEGVATHCGYSGLTPEQGKRAQVVAKYIGTDAAIAMWDYQFNELTGNKQALIRAAYPEIDTADKTTLKQPRELASLAYARAMKVISEPCPRCAGLGHYPSKLDEGICYRCYGRGKILPPITPKLLEELSKHFGGGANG